MLHDDIIAYWDKRNQGYSHKNLKELSSGQAHKWQKELERWLPQDQSAEILDVGTGPGFFPIILKQMGYGRVTAIDASSKMLQTAQANLRQLGGPEADEITFQQMDAQQLSFAPERFDVIVMRNVTWNLEKPEVAYANWLEVLKPGGKLLIYDANWYSYLNDVAVRQAFAENLQRASEEKLEDYWHGEGVDEARIEAIARQLPLTNRRRPEWDQALLSHYPYVSVDVDLAFGQKIWSREEELNYAATPMFALYVHKQEMP